MGQRGPVPVPTATLAARGSRLVEGRAGEVQFTKVRPDCPAFLTPEGKKEWERQVEELDLAGILQVTDRAMLALWCEAWGEFVATAYAIDELVRPNPLEGMKAAIATGLLNVKKGAAERMIRLSHEFGFSPSARARITAVEKETGDASGKARFFGGK